MTPWQDYAKRTVRSRLEAASRVEITRSKLIYPDCGVSEIEAQVALRTEFNRLLSNGEITELLPWSLYFTPRYKLVRSQLEKGETS